MKKRVRVTFGKGGGHLDGAIELARDPNAGQGGLVKVRYPLRSMPNGVYVGWIRADRVERLSFTRQLLAAARPLSVTPPWLALNRERTH